MLKRNPFPNIGKVIKYELKNTYPKMLTVFAIILLLSLIKGIIGNNGMMRKFENSVGNMSINITSTDILGSLMTSLYVLAIAVSFFYMIFMLEKRFKRGMLQEEAYVNLSLPVTIGEHLWGRFIAYFIWFAAFLVVVALSGFLFNIRNLSYASSIKKDSMNDFMELGLNEEYFHKMMIHWIITFYCGCITYAIWFITAIFVINAAGSILRHGKGIMTVFVILLVFLIPQTIISQLIKTITSISGGYDGVKSMYYMFLSRSWISFYVLWGVSVLNFAGTHLIFAKKMNLQ